MNEDAPYFISEWISMCFNCISKRARSNCAGTDGSITRMVCI